MEQETIRELIAKAGTMQFFTGETAHGRVDDIESQLAVILPESYRWFVRTYGMGGVSGVEILGVNKDNSLACVETTLRRREYGLPPHFVVIEDVGEYQYCLDTSKLEDGECPVVNWAQSGPVYFESDNFYQFVIDRFSDALYDEGLL